MESAFDRYETNKKAGLNASFSNGLNRLIQAEPTPV